MNNEQTQIQSGYIGIDVSKLTLDVSFITETGLHCYKQVENSKPGFRKLDHWLRSLEYFNYTSTLFCLEHTGIYTRELVQFLLGRNGCVWMESALQLKRSMGMTRGKNDKIDSYRIARYAMVNADRAKLLNLTNSTLQLLKDLNSSRTRINKSIQSIQVAIKEMIRIDKKTGRALARLNKPALQGLLKSKRAIEDHMQELIRDDAELKKYFDLVTSVKGVGRVLALELLVYTHKFTRLTNGKQLACYCGVAPFAHTSGTSIRGRMGTSNFANMQLKSTLHLAALTSCKNVPDLKKYFERKVAEGKSKMTVLNAIRNKLLQRVLAVVKRQTPYILNYTEINFVKS